LRGAWNLQIFDGTIFAVKKSFFEFQYLIEHGIDCSWNDAIIHLFPDAAWVKEKNVLRLLD
jgi:hypothetical protein